MKNSLKILLKGLLLIVLFSGSTIALSTAGVKTVNEAKAAVPYEQVYQHLVSLGYEVITLNPISGSKGPDWTAHTVRNQVHYFTFIDVNGTQIVAVESNPM